jgi:hypothetical protein
MTQARNQPSGQLLTVALFYVALFGACHIFWEDFWTGLMGYALSPSAKLFTETTITIAVLLQIVPLLIFLTRPTPRGAGKADWSRAGIRQWLLAYARDRRTWVLVGCLLADGVYDAIFRVSLATNPGEWLWSVMESLLIYTLGSEVLLIWSFTNFVERGVVLLLPLGEAVRAWWFRKSLEARQHAALSGNGTGRYARGADEDDSQRVARLQSPLGARAGQ